MTKPGRPRTNFKTVTKTSQVGTRENETRATFIVNEELLGILKQIAHIERIAIKDALNEALVVYIDQYKKQKKDDYVEWLEGEHKKALRELNKMKKESK